MATNNYFGFAHGGTQYGATGAAAYQAAAAAGQTGYAVTPASAAPATYQTQRAATTGYENAYQAATTHTAPGTYAVTAGTTATGTSYDYNYGRSAQTTATAYDSSKTYYQQPTAAATAATYSGTETHYQASKPAFSTPSSNYNATTRQATPTTTPKAATGYNNTAYTAQSTTNYSGTYATPAQANNTSYDAALYSAATMYVQQQAQNTGKPQGNVANTWQSYKKGPMSGPGAGKPVKPKQPPKPQQLHYCDVCKISCAGPQTYREHLEGQKHKKKEAAMKAGTASATRGGNALRCELCDVTCTGSDAYAAHIRGVKHQKVVKLHTKLGKPIPSTEPHVVGGSKASSVTSKTSAGTGTQAGQVTGGTKKPLSATSVPKINFTGTAVVKEEDEDAKSGDDLKLEEKEIQPVGQDYIEEIKNDDGKVISFNCKLCECRFNDPNAKEMHMKGRRHRLQYKKKVNPDLVVDVKPSLRQRKMQEEKLRRQHMREEFWRRRDEERLMGEDDERMFWEERRRYEEEMEWFWRHGRDHRGPPMRPPFGPGGPPPHMLQMMRRPDSSDDRHVLARHAEIYPTEEELQAVQRIVSHAEKALKLVSDHLVDAQPGAKPAAAAVVVKQETAPAAKPAAKDATVAATAAAAAKTDAKDDATAQVMPKKEDGRDGTMFSFHRSKEECAENKRTLKGVMRVGVLAKGLLLRGDATVRLVVLCSDKPTTTLLNQLASMLPAQLKSVAPEDNYEVSPLPQECAVQVLSTSAEPRITVHICLTSPVVREQPVTEGEPHEAARRPVGGLLDKQQCLDALAALRHAKWFQARATGLQSCVMVIRILRDLCQRVPTWSPFSSWAMELLAEKVLSSTGQPQSPGDALRRIMEALASGILLPGGPGLLDPCEKDPTDAAGKLTPQEREDITASAQHALRLISFRQIHKVLGMDPLPPPKFTRGRFNRKRRRDNSSGEGNDSEGGDGKKDKKEEDDVKMDTEKVTSESVAA